MPHRDPPCPQAAKHTPCPTSYTGWHDWADRMARTHDQVRCDGCGKFAIWVPKTAARDPTTDPGQNTDTDDSTNEQE